MQDAADLLARMRKAIVDHENKFGKPRTEPIELTTEQYERLKKACATATVYPAGGAPSAFCGVRVVIKD